MIKTSIVLGTALFNVFFFTGLEKEALYHLNPCTTPADSLTMEDITYLEEEEEIELGFDTAIYLPLDFNAYEGMEFDLKDIPFFEEVEEPVLDFNTADYLPEGFDAYAEPEFDLANITFIEEEEDIVLGFDTKRYLPKDFKATR